MTVTFMLSNYTSKNQLSQDKNKPELNMTNVASNYLLSSILGKENDDLYFGSLCYAEVQKLATILSQIPDVYETSDTIAYGDNGVTMISCGFSPARLERYGRIFTAMIDSWEPQNICSYG